MYPPHLYFCENARWRRSRTNKKKRGEKQCRTLLFPFPYSQPVGIESSTFSVRLHNSQFRKSTPRAYSGASGCSSCCCSSSSQLGALDSSTIIATTMVPRDRVGAIGLRAGAGAGCGDRPLHLASDHLRLSPTDGLSVLPSASGT